MGYTYAVFGLGRQGTAAVYDLVRNCEADRVIGIDPVDDMRDAAADRLKAVLGAAVPIQLVDNAALDWRWLSGQCDVVLSCAPYRYNPEIARHCVQAGLPMCDLGGNPDVVAEQQRLAAGKRVPVVPECGLSPGISNVAAVHLARTHQADRITVRCGGLPQTPPDPTENPLQYKLVFDPQGLISEYSGACPSIEDGEIRFLPACEFAEDFDEDHECFPTSNNAPQVAEYLLECGVRWYNYMTIRYKGHLARVEGLRVLGYLRGDAELDKQLRAALMDNETLRYDPARDRDKVILLVRGTRESGGLSPSWEYRIDVAADHRTGFSAMELTTSWGGTVVAHHLVNGQGAPDGFSTPERFVDTTWFLNEIDRRLKQVS